MKLKKLFLNDNNIYFLPKGIFDDFDVERLEVVDLSRNQWECICGKEWLGIWLMSIGSANFGAGNLGCLEKECGESEQRTHSIWINGAAICLSVVTICCILAIAYLMLQELRHHWPKLQKPIASDKEKLIPESLSFPNPVAFPDFLESGQKIENSPPLIKKPNSSEKHVRFSSN